MFAPLALHGGSSGPASKRSRYVAIHSDAVATCSSLRCFTFHGLVVLLLPVSSSAWLDLGHGIWIFTGALPSALTEPASSAPVVGKYCSSGETVTLHLDCTTICESY